MVDSRADMVAGNSVTMVCVANKTNNADGGRRLDLELLTHQGDLVGDWGVGMMFLQQCHSAIVG